MLKQFYEKVLPGQGVYCVSGIEQSGRITNRFAETLSEVLEKIELLKEKQNNVFVALGTFKQHSRRAEEALFLRSFFIDLDIGGTPGKYPDQDSALAELNSFVSTVGLPPPIIVNSGRGVHAYWPFADDVPAAEWKPYAQKFKELCLKHLKIDPSVTADVSRILRAPETLNYKTDPPSPTGFYNPEVVEGYPGLDFEMFKEFLGPVDLPLDAVLGAVEKGLDDDTKAFVQKDTNYETLFSVIAEKSCTDKGCAQIKHILVNAKTLDQPMWHSGLSIARHCTDWETAIHLMSEDHPSYNHDQTIRKANETLNKPHSCEVFEQRNPGGCEGCPFRGKITNPLALGRVFSEASETEADPVRQNADPQAVPVIPKDLYPFVRGKNGGVYYIPKAEEDDDGNKIDIKPKKISTYDIYPVKRVYSSTEGAALYMRYVLPKDPDKEFILRLRYASVVDELKKIMADNDLLLDKEQAGLMAAYIKAWNEYLQMRTTAEIMRNQMGWTEDRSAFVFGTSEITEHGERGVAVSPLVKNVSKCIGREGTYEKWRTAVDILNNEGFELHLFGLLCGLGSPLMHLTSTAGVSYCFMSQDSGVGKTGTTYAGTSLFAHPMRLLVQEGSATDNALVGRYLALKNMMFVIDEVGAIDPDVLGKMIHRISQGRAKLRMQSSVNAERELEMSASLINIMTSNVDLYDRLSISKSGANGEMARLVQFMFRKPQLMIDHPEVGEQLFGALTENYGHAGPMFIHEYFRLGQDKVKEYIKKWKDRAGKDLSNDSAYRFYVNSLAVSFAGGEIANNAGIVNVDLEKVYKRVIIEMIQLRDKTVKLNKVDYMALFELFMAENHSGLLIFNDGQLVSAPSPSSPLIGRIEVHNQVQYISRTAFKDFITAKQVSTGEFEAAARAEGALIDVKKVRLATGWKSGMGSTNGVTCYAFKTVPSKELPNVEVH
jgi:hypothetical protein